MLMFNKNYFPKHPVNGEFCSICYFPILWHTNLLINFKQVATLSCTWITNWMSWTAFCEWGIRCRKWDMGGWKGGNRKPCSGLPVCKAQTATCVPDRFICYRSPAGKSFWKLHNWLMAYVHKEQQLIALHRFLLIWFLFFFCVCVSLWIHDSKSKRVKEKELFYKPPIDWYLDSKKTN